VGRAGRSPSYSRRKPGGLLSSCSSRARKTTMPENSADLRGLGPEFFSREEAMLDEHRRRVTGLANIFQRLPWLTARSPLGDGFEMDFLLMHSLMRPPGTPSSLVHATTFSGAVSADALRDGDAAAAALEAKRRLFLRQKRPQNTPMRRRPSFQVMSVAPGSGGAPGSRPTSWRLRSSSDASIGISAGGEVIVASSEETGGCGGGEIVAEEAAEADEAALAKFRQPCERWACDEESLLLNRLVDLTARHTADGHPLPRAEVLSHLAEEFGPGAMQRLRGPIVHALRGNHSSSSSSDAASSAPSSSSEPGPSSGGGSGSPGNPSATSPQPLLLSPFALAADDNGNNNNNNKSNPVPTAPAAAVAAAAARRRRRSPSYERDMFVRHVLRFFYPAQRTPPAEIAAAAELLSHPILRGHVGMAWHPLLHEELCVVPPLSAATMETLERQQAMFLTCV
jgi:hypothetical protein